MARVRESELVIPALHAMAVNGGTITMTDLIERMEVHFQPDGEDTEIIEGRNDSKFSQKVRNLVSHREAESSMFSKRYAIYYPETESIEITDAGREFLDQVPEA